VRETEWHRSEEVEEQPDGSLIWRAKVAEPQEMVPWIRGWGADVEVLGPDDLRGQMTGEARRLAKSYGWDVHRAEQDDAADDDHQFFDDFFGG
jgi:predicted DNA-binding transcriptional regulator YafY